MQMTAEDWNRLGSLYYWGDEGEIDLHRSAYYYEMAAKAGHVDAMFSTGMNYAIGCGVPQDVEKCLSWLNKAVENGHTDAMNYLGLMYYQGDVVAKDFEKSLHYFEMGAKAGNPYAMADAAKQYEKGEGTERDESKAKQLYEQAYETLYRMAVEGDHEAQLWMGNWYYYGCALMGVSTSYVQAVSWYKKAAEGCLPEAQYRLGICYSYGLGVGQDYEKAAQLFELAAQKQEPTAICNLARMFEQGWGVEKDMKKAAENYCLAANLGYDSAQVALGDFYMEGKGVEQDYQKAVYWYKKACESNNEAAPGCLAKCYMKGLGVAEDREKAFELYGKGAELGDLEARVSLAQCYMEGWGTEKDRKMAVDMLEAVCQEASDYREEATTSIVEEEWVYNPFEPERIEIYEKAFSLLAELNNGGCGTTKIEVRDLGSWKKGQMCRFAITIHHADGSCSDLRFKTQRNKLVYLLSLLFAYNRQTAGLMARYFAFGRDLLVRLAKEAAFDVQDFDTWIDEFIYKEVYVADANRYQYEYSNSRYSIAVSQANEFLRESCGNDEEYKAFCLRKTGGRESVASVAVKPEQIVLPQSLVKFAEQLPTSEELLGYRCPQARPIRYSEYLQSERDKLKHVPRE